MYIYIAFLKLFFQLVNCYFVDSCLPGSKRSFKAIFKEAKKMNFAFYVTVSLIAMSSFGFFAELDSCQGTTHLPFLFRK